MASTHFRYDCPHCLTRNAGFRAAYQWPDRDFANLANVLAICGVCNGGLLIYSRDSVSSAHRDLTKNELGFPNEHLRIILSWPTFESKAPEHVPPNVGGFYEQGLENLKERRWDAAGAMFRKSLDVATKHLAPEHKSLTLFARINKLAEAGSLTTAMSDWSHEIRLDGNDAVHDEEPETEEDARATHKFTEAVLTYAFTLPQMVTANRDKRKPERSKSTSP